MLAGKCLILPILTLYKTEEQLYLAMLVWVFFRW